MKTNRFHPVFAVLGLLLACSTPTAVEETPGSLTTAEVASPSAGEVTSPVAVNGLAAGEEPNLADGLTPNGQYINFAGGCNLTPSYCKAKCGYYMYTYGSPYSCPLINGVRYTKCYCSGRSF